MNLHPDSNYWWRYYSNRFDASNRLWRYIKGLQADGWDVQTPSKLLHEGVIEFGVWLQRHPASDDDHVRQAALTIIRPYIARVG